MYDRLIQLQHFCVLSLIPKLLLVSLVLETNALPLSCIVSGNSKSLISMFKVLPRRDWRSVGKTKWKENDRQTLL